MRNAVAPRATSADCETTPIPVGTGDLADKLLGRALKEPYSQGRWTRCAVRRELTGQQYRPPTLPSLIQRLAGCINASIE